MKYLLLIIINMDTPIRTYTNVSFNKVLLFGPSNETPDGNEAVRYSDLEILKNEVSKILADLNDIKNKSTLQQQEIDKIDVDNDLQQQDIDILDVDNDLQQQEIAILAIDNDRQQQEIDILAIANEIKRQEIEQINSTSNNILRFSISHMNSQSKYG